MEKLLSFALKRPALAGVWRRPPVAFVAGAATFVVLPVSLLMLLCAVFAR
jgi:hypothetical protein